ncbi:granulin a isoform X2 [Hoplias malabaricus]|uniref:granulin a isoform X2 n=1 Tax=Hoplias malabaricus TaxID=27720 RepID=UPI0034628B54
MKIPAVAARLLFYNLQRRRRRENRLTRRLWERLLITLPKVLQVFLKIHFFFMHLNMLKLTLGLSLLSLVVSSKCPSEQLCRDRETCCLIQTSGEYSCCPFHQGECCEDHLHCCPEGMLCQTAESSCSNSTHSVPWTERRTATQTLSLAKSFRMISATVASKDNIICPDNSSCPAEFSCLKLTDKYSCCPVTQGIVCSDGKHCCPSDHDCSIDSTSCVRKREPVKAVICADGMSECPVQTSCCKTADGSWGCCPMPRAVCCADNVHCCPEDTVCHINSSKCVSSTRQELPMWSKFPARLRAAWEDHKVSDVPCDDTVACKDGQTCCKDGKGGWACCPMEQAVCCEDFMHCCPHGTVCNLPAGTCDTPSGSVPWLEKRPSRPIRGQKPPQTKVSDVPCDDTVACKDGQTCCKDGKGGWACCPMEQAVCCEDFMHCCPHGTVCNLPAGTCDTPSGSVPWLEKRPSRPIRGQKPPQTKVSDVPCDDTVACKDGQTCCKDGKGGWACCPMEQAVCCEDFMHCCPHGTVCNLPAGTCDTPSGSVPWLEKRPSRPIRGQKPPQTKVSDVPCDDTVACKDGQTCCKDGKGGWACCPMEQAVCCEDFMHCCPHGTVCNLPAGTCDTPSGSVPWLEKRPSRPIRGQKPPQTKVSDVPCDDTVACKDGQTCCKDGKGGWACCPMEQAVCCEDFMHCCPQGTVCNLPAGTCDTPSGSVPWLEKKPSRPITGQKHEGKGLNAANISCDSSHSCPASNSCCKDLDGNWGCCPFSQGVCCQDHLHCCPHDTKCNFRTLSCDSGSSSVPMAMIISARTHGQQKKVKEEKPKEDNSSSGVQCDEHTSCPDHSTCCFIGKTNKWGCCPLTNAVCCQDGEHCCPDQYKCDRSQTSCVKGQVVIPWYTKIAAESSSDLSSIRCDSQTNCPIGATCCRLGSGKWGCCPLPEATCCSDREHCCPKGFMCDEDTGSCVKSILLQVETVPLTSIRHLQTDKQCGGGYTCSESETCCRTSQTSWSCCPSPQAVCCSDMKHCCPAGYVCENNGMCTQATAFNWDHWQVFFSRKKRALLV